VNKLWQTPVFNSFAGNIAQVSIAGEAFETSELSTLQGGQTVPLRKI